MQRKTLTKPLQLLLTLLILVSCENDQDKQKRTTIQTQAQNNSNQEVKKPYGLNPEIPTDLICLNNQGVGQMGNFDYANAVVTFEKLIESSPNVWTLAQQNYAIALLNRQKPKDEEKALKLAQDLVKKNDSNLVAHYIVGILNFNQGMCDQALPHFQQITKKDPSDGYALYFSGQCFLQNGEVEKALALYKKAIAADSYLRSAYYGSFMAAQRLEKAELAKKMLAAYQKLGTNPKARLAEIKYTRMGPKANARSYGLKHADMFFKKLEPPFFLKPKVLNFENVEQFGVVNLKQTQQTQLYIVNHNNFNIYTDFLNKAEKIEHLSLKLNDAEHKLAWGDINNDGKLDVYITGRNDQMYYQTDTGFDAVDMQTFGIANLQSKAIRLIDADHDGDLDVLVLSQTGRFEIWNNNLNNTFTALSTKTKLSTKEGFNAIYIADIDSDRDVDIILQGANSYTIALNDRMWDYQIIDSLKYKTTIKSMSFVDNGSDGSIEMMILMSKGNLITQVFNKNLNFMQDVGQMYHVSKTNAHVLDITGNGKVEILAQHDDEIKIISLNGKPLGNVLIKTIKQVKQLNTTKGAELLVLAENKLYHVAASNSRHPFMLLTLSGKEDDANSVRSNYSGIGTEFVLRNQSFYVAGDSFYNTNGVEQDYQALSIATGSKNPIDYIEFEWSDGVYQTELSLKTNTFHRITETQRQLSSCPVVFAWNNGSYEFISDVLGVGGIGFAIGRHEYGEPRPWENYLLSANQISSEGGVFKLQFTEPMEESAYLDALKIQVIDVPQDFSVVLDERMAIAQPVVTGKPIFFKNTIKPKKVTTKLGKDVTDYAASTDKIAIPLENTDTRFLGLLDEQVITMEFDSSVQGEYQLIMNGWVEYGYSQTMFAAWQAGQIAQAPTLEYLVNDEWQVLLKEFGYPAGMPRSASVPINIPQETKKLRIRTNMEVYFDELALVQTQKPENIKTYDLQLQSARLKQLGFPKRENNNQRVPSYDFSEIQPFWDTRYMHGAYTRLGDITALINRTDNALAIIGAGEGIELAFVDDLPALSTGYNRYYLLKFTGWAKDMDILTNSGENLKPIPFDGVVSPQAKALNKQYNTRFKAGK